MNALAVLLAVSPVIFVFLLLAVGHAAADTAGVAGWVFTVTVACLFFDTPLAVALQASLAGILASLPIALVVATSILQVTIMIETGAIARVVALIKSVAPGDRVVQIMLINVGFGTMLTALGAVPVSILPPIMLALGYSSFTAIALPALGYDALTTYALLGIPVVVFAGFVGKPVGEVGGYFARYMPVISTCIALGMLWLVGRWALVRQGALPAVLAGLTAGFLCLAATAAGLVTVTGIIAGLGVILVMLVYLKVRRRPLRDRRVLGPADLAAEERLSLGAALSPWLILTALALVINAPFLTFFDLVFRRCAMPVEIIPGAPERVRLLWQAYFWILASTILALPFLKATRPQLATSLRKWLKRAPRPVLAAAIFFAIAFVINHSGKGTDWSLAVPENNMVHVLATASAAALGGLHDLSAADGEARRAAARRRAATFTWERAVRETVDTLEAAHRSVLR